MEVGGGREEGIEEEIEKRRSEGGEGRVKVERGERKGLAYIVLFFLCAL